MTKKYKVCLIGCGRMGATIDDEVKDQPHSSSWIPYSHAAAICAIEEAAFVGLSDVVPEKVEAIRQRYNVPRGYTDYREMLEKEQPDMVCIATRPASHRELVVYAAEYGVKGIYCEKPLCCSMAEADAMVEACDRHGVKFNYGTQRRACFRNLFTLFGIGRLEGWKDGRMGGSDSSSILPPFQPSM